jgi:hypothetical protein
MCASAGGNHTQYQNYGIETRAGPTESTFFASRSTNAHFFLEESFRIGTMVFQMTPSSIRLFVGSDVIFHDNGTEIATES